MKLAEGPDPETRAAARRLISLIDRSEFHRRLEAFAADTDGRQGLTMPGWDAYRMLVGGDADDRALFVEIQRSEPALLTAVFDDAKRSRDDLLEVRLQGITQWQPNVVNATGSPSLGSCAAMLFLGSIAETELFGCSDRRDLHPGPATAASRAFAAQQWSKGGATARDCLGSELPEQE